MAWPLGMPRQKPKESKNQYRWRVRKWKNANKIGMTPAQSKLSKGLRKFGAPARDWTSDNTFKKSKKLTPADYGRMGGKIRWANAKKGMARTAPKSLAEHKAMLAPTFNAVDVEKRTTPIPKHAQEPLPVRMMPTLTDAMDGGLMQDAAKELRRKGMLIGEGEVNPGVPGVRVTFDGVTIEGPAEQMAEFCKEMEIFADAEE